MKRALTTIFLVLLADQSLKIWIKLSYRLGDSTKVLGDFFYMHFIENPGMAFGLEFGGEIGKLALSIFRIFAICGIGWYLRKIIKDKVPAGFIIAVALIFAGALGNIIDSAFYGLIFDKGSSWNGNYYEGYLEYAQLTTFGSGYAGFLHGNVVDMLYFPIVNGTIPEWVPRWGGDPFIFFRPVFNIADASITIGVALIILKQKTFFKHNLISEKEGESLQEVEV